MSKLLIILAICISLLYQILIVQKIAVEYILTTHLTVSKVIALLQVDHWLRPSEIATDSSDSKITWTVFRTPLPSDISQGNLAPNF